MRILSTLVAASPGGFLPNSGCCILRKLFLKDRKLHFGRQAPVVISLNPLMGLDIQFGVPGRDDTRRSAVLPENKVFHEHGILS